MIGNRKDLHRQRSYLRSSSGHFLNLELRKGHHQLLELLIVEGGETLITLHSINDLCMGIRGEDLALGVKRGAKRVQELFLPSDESFGDKDIAVDDFHKSLEVGKSVEK